MDKRKILIVLFIGVASILQAQTSTNSPYSRFGIGEMSNQGFSMNNSMGGIGIGLYKPNTINYLNPASYTSQDTMSFLFDFGLMGKFSSYTTSVDKNVNNTVSFDHLAIAFPITKWMKASIGVKPYSTVGYDVATPVTDVDFIEEFGVAEFYYKGQGNVNSFYLGTAIQPVKWASLGVNLTYLFGNLEYKNSVGFPQDPYATTTAIFNKHVFRTMYLNIGAQFKIPVNDKNTVVLGAVYGPQANTKMELQKFVYNYYPTENNYLNVDTILYEKGNDVDFIFPLSYGFGITYNWNQRILVGFDYSTENWASSNYHVENQVLKDLVSYRAGLEITPNPYSPRGYFNKINYRAGFYYLDDYLQISDNDLTKWAVTFGLGIPFKYSKSKINLSAEFGKMGSTDNGMIMERYSMFTFGLTLYDVWFYKRKFD